MLDFELRWWLAYTTSSIRLMMALPVTTSAMPKTLPLLYGNVTLESALNNDDNMLQRIAYPDLRFEFYLNILMVRPIG